MCVTSISRKEDKLTRGYRNRKIESEYEMRRRHELTVFLANEQGKEVGEQEGEQLRCPDHDTRYEHYVASHPYSRLWTNRQKPLRC